MQDSTPAADCFSNIFSLRRSAILPGGLYFIIGKRKALSYDKTNASCCCSLCLALPASMQIIHREGKLLHLPRSGRTDPVSRRYIYMPRKAPEQHPCECRHSDGYMVLPQFLLPDV